MSEVEKSEQTSPEMKKSVREADLTKTLVTAAAALVFIIGLRYIASDLISPILLAIFFAVLMYPIFKIFRRKGRSSGVSVFFMILVIALGMTIFGLFLAWSFNRFFDSLGGYLDNFFVNFEDTIALANETVNLEEIDTALVIDTAKSSISEGKILSIVQTLFGSIGNFIYVVVFIPFIAILMLLQIDSMPKKKNLQLESNQTVQKFKKFADTIIVYIIARGKVNAFTGLLFAIALAVIGVDFAILWGILVAFLSFIPYVGIVIASIPPVVIAFAEMGWVAALLVIVAVIIVNVLAENVIDPYVQGQGTKLSAVTIIIMLIFWTWLLGPVGSIMSVPLTVLLKVVFEDFEETRWLAKIMEGNYAESADEIEKRGLVDKVTGRFRR